MSADTDACTTKRAHTKRYCVNISCYSWKCTKRLEFDTLNKDQVRTVTPTFVLVTIVLVTIVKLISRRLLWCRKIRQIMEHKNEDFFVGEFILLKVITYHLAIFSPFMTYSTCAHVVFQTQLTNPALRVNIKENFVNFGKTGQG